MVKTNVKVFVRARPTASSYDGLKLSADSSSVTLHVPKDASMGLINNQQETFAFKFDGVLENASQTATYTAAAHEVVDSLLQGINGTIFCYGQTGAGKTFTMAGDLRNYQHRGIIPQAVHHLFREIDMRVDKLYKVHVSYLELYNDQLYDLLSDKPGSSEDLVICEDSHGGTFVRGLTTLPAGSEEAALMSYFAGDQGRSTASHVLNASSSRSHCVFTLHVEMRTSESASEKAVLSKLHLVDLAGSERTKKTGVSGQALIEAQFINRSLSFLEQTVNALTKKDAYIPYRQSKLTAVLRDALGGNCKTVMIANICGEPAHVVETLSTLRFASRVRTLVTDVHSNESNDPGLLLRKYERQIKELKQELAMRDALSGRGRISYDDLTDVEIRAINALARSFLSGAADVEQLPVDTVRSIHEVYKQMRGVYQAVAAEAGAAAAAAPATVGAGAQTASGGDDGGDGVGVVESGGIGFAVGTAPAGARPVASEGGGLLSMPPVMTMAGTPRGQRGSMGGMASAAASQAAEYGFGGGDPGSPGAPQPGPGLPGSTLSMPERRAAFSRFNKDIEAGRSLATVVSDRTAHMADLKRRIKDSSSRVNTAKAEIDGMSAQLAQSTQGAPAAGTGDVLDAERHSIMAQLKAAKSKYRAAFDEFKELRDELDPSTQGVAEAKQILIDEFNRWVETPNAGAAVEPTDKDELDAAEAFERMQVSRMTANDPDSVSYHTAVRKAGAAPGALTGAAGTARFGGVKAKGEATRRREAEQAIAAGTARV